MMQEIAQGISLALTSTTVVVCLMVAWHWRESFLKPSEDGAVFWFSLGVLVHFICSLVDNLYWGVVWSFNYMHLPILTDLGFDYGVYSNIVFRQLGTIFAGYCHLRAAFIYAKVSHSVINYALLLSVIAGLIYIVVIG